MFPAPDTLLQIAQVQKSYGTEGEVIINFSAEAYDYFDEKRPVFLFFDGLPVPFFVESFETKGTRKALVRLTDINTMSRAEEIVGQKIYISATPADFELKSSQQLVEQIIRPTGLLDPKVEVRPIQGQIDDIVNEIIIYYSVWGKY